MATVIKSETFKTQSGNEITVTLYEGFEDKYPYTVVTSGGGSHSARTEKAAEKKFAEAVRYHKYFLRNELRGMRVVAVYAKTAYGE